MVMGVSFLTHTVSGRPNTTVWAILPIRAEALGKEGFRELESFIKLFQTLRNAEPDADVCYEKSYVFFLFYLECI